jgi:ankyrin repeat protein
MGCDVNAQNTYNDVPLHFAIDSFDPTGTGVGISVLMYLLGQENVNVNIKGHNSNTLLHVACDNINKLPLEIFKLLIETLGCDVNAQDNYKNTPIHSAIDQFKPSDGGDINVLAYLINQKTVNVNTGYRKSYTLLHSACIINIFIARLSAGQNAENDTISCQIVELIAERLVQEVLKEKGLLETTIT